MQTDDRDEIQAAEDAAFDAAFDNLGLNEAEESASEGEEAPEENPPKELDAEEEATQDSASDHPSTVARLAEAMDEIHRAGLTPSSLKGKSEAELLELGTELSTLRRQRDREYSQRQTQEQDGAAVASQESGPEGEAAEGGTEAGSPEVTPEFLEDAITAMADELGEEAARPLREVFEAQQREIAALRAQVSESAQARQAERLEAQIEAVRTELVREHQVLSNPETWQEAVVKANSLALTDAEKYQALPESEQLRAVLQDAVVALDGERKAATKRKASAGSPTVPGARPAGRPAASWDEAFDREFERLER